MAGNILPGLNLECLGPDQLSSVVQQTVEFSGDLKVWLFEGEMGAGKTTFIVELCQYFKVIDHVNSPTFSIVNEYRNEIDDIFYHFDFYRIKDEFEAMDIGVEEYFYSGNYCFIEWPSKITDLLPDQVLKVKISVGENEKRLIELTKND